MSNLAKFLFDTEFDPKAGGVQAAVSQKPEKTYWTTPERDAASAEAFERGKQAGIQGANAQIAAQTAAALDIIAQNVVNLTNQLGAENARLKSEAVILANTIASSLASSLVQLQPLQEVETLFDEALNFMPNNPHIAVRLSEAHLDLAKEKLNAIAADRGFPGKLIILADPNVQSGDCRIEWASGSIIKDHLEIKNKIHELTIKYIDATHQDSAAELEEFDVSTFLPSSPPEQTEMFDTITTPTEAILTSEDT